MLKPIFQRNWRKRYPMATRADGCYIYDDQGNRYLDAVGAVYVVNIGHGVQEIADAMHRQASAVAFPYGGSFTTQAELDLAEELLGMAPTGMQSAYFVSGGSEANEVAFKIARKYQIIKGRPERWRIVGRWQSYHGATMATLAAGGNRGRRSEFLPYMLDFPHVDPPYCYRCPWHLAYPSCELTCAQDLDRVIKEEGEQSIAAFICEPIVGASGGAIVPPPEYYLRVRDICDKYDILFIADEVITGFGRTGANFAMDLYGVVPDIITCGKGMSSGYLPLGAVIIHERVMRVFEESPSNSLFTGYTFSGHPVTCAAGLGVLRYLKQHQLVERAKREGQWFYDELQGLGTHASVGDVRGKGMLIGIEFVADKASRAPFDAEIGFATRVVDKAWEMGVMLRSETGTIDGLRGEHILLSPPLTIERSELDVICQVLDAAITSVEEEVGLTASVDVQPRGVQVP